LTDRRIKKIEKSKANKDKIEQNELTLQKWELVLGEIEKEIHPL